MAILPQLEQAALYEQFAQDQFIAGPWRTGSDTTWVPRYAEAIAARPKVFVCPSDASEPCCEMTSDNVVVGKQHFLDSTDRCAATGNYALSFGSKGEGSPGGSTGVKYRNNGAFLYVKGLQAKQFEDGLTHTFFVGEGVETHTLNGALVWSLGYRHTTLRSTFISINTPPGTGITQEDYGRFINGAFQSKHPGGALFVSGDGHVGFASESISDATYNALGTRAGDDFSNDDI